jgi:hypothetical protein
MKELKLTKPRARNEIFFKPDKDDEWFVYIIHKEKKSGKKRSCMIIQKDMDMFLQRYISQGWVIDDGKEPVKVVKKPTKPKAVKIK